MTEDPKFTIKGDYTQPIKPIYHEPYAYKGWEKLEESEWRCYLFGNRPDSTGIVYTPMKGRVPNRFVRWMMKVCFDCLWVKEKP